MPWAGRQHADGPPSVRMHRLPAGAAHPRCVDYPSVSIDDFASHEAADFWIRKNLGGDQVARGFSADVYIVQRGDVFSVVVSKTRLYFDFLLQGFFDSQQELAALRQYTF